MVLKLLGLLCAVLAGWALAGALLFTPAHWARKRYRRTVDDDESSSLDTMV